MASNRLHGLQKLARVSCSTIREPDTHVRKSIAKVSGLPKTNVYCYFPTKECIYTAVTEPRSPG